MTTATVASVVRGGLSAADIERMNEQLTNPAGATVEPPPPLPKLEKGQKCFRSTQGLRLLVQDIKEREVNGTVIPGSRKWAEFKRHVSGQCFELVTDDKDKIEAIEKEIARTGGVLVWEAEEQVENYRDAEAERIAAALADPDMAKRVSGIGASRDSFSLEPVKPKQKAGAGAGEKDKA